MTNSGVYLNKLNPFSDEAENKTPKLHLFRIGHYQEEGETINASATMNSGADPLPLSHHLRTRQRWLKAFIYAT